MQLGLALVFSGKPEEGVEALNMALRYDPNSPRQPYFNQLAVGAFHAGNFEAALEFLDRNLERGGPYGPHIMAYRAAAFAALGRTEEEQEVLTEIANQTKDAGVDWIREWLHRTTPHENIIAPVLAELDKVAKRD